MKQTGKYSTMIEPLKANGWHLRPAGLLVSIANMFESEIVVKCGQRIASAKSILEVMMLGAGKDAKLCVSACGRDAQKAIMAIQARFTAERESEGKGPGVPPPTQTAPLDGGRSPESKALPKTATAPTPKTAPSGVQATTFTLRAPPFAQVFLAGDFNRWDPKANPMSHNGSRFSLNIKLPPGRYQYKYIIDGEWTVDPTAPMTVSNIGTTNNVVTV